MGDLIERLDRLIAHHQTKAGYWSARDNARQTAIHYDAITTLRETINRLRAIPEDKS